MSLFSRLRNRGGGDAGLRQQILVPAVSTMVADGSVDKSEIAQLSSMLSFSPIFAGMESEELVGHVDSILADIRANGHDRTIQASASELSPALRETALAFACRIAMADGKIEDGEVSSILQTCQHLGLSADLAKTLLGVSAILQRGPDD